MYGVCLSYDVTRLMGTNCDENCIPWKQSVNNQCSTLEKAGSQSLDFLLFPLLPRYFISVCHLIWSLFISFISTRLREEVFVEAGCPSLDEDTWLSTGFS